MFGNESYIRSPTNTAWYLGNHTLRASGVSPGVAKTSNLTPPNSKSYRSSNVMVGSTLLRGERASSTSRFSSKLN